MAWSLGAVKTFTIGNSADGSAVTPVDIDLDNAKALVITCEDCQYIQASTSLSAQVGYDESDTMCALYELDDPSTAWSKGSLPTSGTLAFVLTHAFGARRLRLILSNAASGGSVVFKVIGIDGSGG